MLACQVGRRPACKDAALLYLLPATYDTRGLSLSKPLRNQVLLLSNYSLTLQAFPALAVLAAAIISELAIIMAPPHI